MVWNYAYGFVVPMALAILTGFPVAAWCGVGRGVRAVGYASAFGTAVLLIACRGVQMLWPLRVASWPMLGLLLAALLVAWSRPSTRSAFRELFKINGRGCALLFMAALGVGVLLGKPILFGTAIQYDGSRNADSFTFTQSAQYMLGHVFHEAPNFTPEWPVYTISRGYFGDRAVQPRPAAEGLLAWLSALRAMDPMYLYNGVQSAGIMLAGLAALAFLPLEWRARSAKDWGLLAVYIAACPTLVHIATNSNFANAYSLPAATAYVALGLMPRTRGTFFAGVLCIGTLFSGYPELLVFAALARGLGVALEALAGRAIGSLFREGLWMAAELAMACVLWPWAAVAAFVVYKTTLGISHAGASELGGNMFAGVPLWVASALALASAWRALGEGRQRGRRWYLLAMLAAFALAQGLMLARGFDYGGFKISQYFVTLLIGVVLRSVLSAPAGVPLGRLARSMAIILAVLMVVKTTGVVRRAWDWSRSRRVTPDLVAAGQALAGLSHGLPVELGSSPQPFYYGMWVAYIATAPIAYDLRRDKNAAGYLSPYLRASGQAQNMLDAAQLRLDVDAGKENTRAAIAWFGSNAIRERNARLRNN